MEKKKKRRAWTFLLLDNTRDKRNNSLLYLRVLVGEATDTGPENVHVPYAYNVSFRTIVNYCTPISVLIKLFPMFLFYLFYVRRTRLSGVSA